MKKLLYVVLLFIISGFTSKNSNLHLNFRAEIITIEYYTDCDCSKKSPILVRVAFNVNEKDIKSLKMILKYPDDITMTMPVKEVNKSGQIIYSFCAKQDSELEFSVVFVKPSGEKSNIVVVRPNIRTAEYKTISPPTLIPLN